MTQQLQALRTGIEPTIVVSDILWDGECGGVVFDTTALPTSKTYPLSELDLQGLDVAADWPSIEELVLDQLSNETGFCITGSRIRLVA